MERPKNQFENWTCQHVKPCLRDECIREQRFWDGAKHGFDIGFSKAFTYYEWLFTRQSKEEE